MFSDCDGTIRGVLCQLWSEIGSLKGINDCESNCFINIYVF